MLFRSLFPVRLGLLLWSLLAIPVQASDSLQSDSLQLVTSVRPITLLVQELAEGLPVDVKTLLPQGVTPHDYALKPSDLKAIQSADLVVWLGSDSEPYLGKVITKADASLDWSALPGLNRLPPRDALHTSNDSHSHDAGYDLHFWFSADNAITLAEALTDILSEQNPQMETPLQNRLAELRSTLKQQREQTRSLLQGNTRPFLLVHDAYQYLEADLGVESVAAIVVNQEITPGARHLMSVKQQVEKNNVGCVITEPGANSGMLDKIDRNPPMTRMEIDPMTWDFREDRFSLWLSSVYVKVVVCVGDGEG